MQVVYKGEGNIFTVQWSTEIGVTSFLPKQRQVQWKGAVGQLLYIIYAVTLIIPVVIPVTKEKAFLHQMSLFVLYTV